MKEKNTYSRGMTFIEVVIWVSIFTVVISAISSSILFLYRTNKTSFEQAFAISSAQQGLREVMRTIRESQYSIQGAFPIVSIAANDFAFYADVNDDGRVDRVHYFLQGNNLMRGVISPSGNPISYTGSESVTTAATYVRNISQGVDTFRYFDKLGAEITNYDHWTSVRFVTVRLAVRVSDSPIPDQFSLYSSAAIRNLINK